MVLLFGINGRFMRCFENCLFSDEVNSKTKKEERFFAPLELLFYDSHFINQVTAITQLVDNEENVADIYCDTTLEVVVEVDVTTQ